MHFFTPFQHLVALGSSAHNVPLRSQFVDLADREISVAHKSGGLTYIGSETEDTGCNQFAPKMRPRIIYKSATVNEESHTSHTQHATYSSATNETQSWLPDIFAILTFVFRFQK